MSNFYTSQVQKHGYWWSGNYASWQDASKECTGYSAGNILKQVESATLAAQQSENVYEIDGVIHKGKPRSASKLLTEIKQAAVGNKIEVIDFGGSLGTTYYQLKKYMANYEIRWNVIEQNNFVECGKRLFQNDVLKFYETTDECMAAMPASNPCFLASGSLNYIEDPYAIIRSLSKHNFNTIILDRVSCSDSKVDKLTIQIVPPFIYEAIYPCWFLSSDKLIATFKDIGFAHIETFPVDGTKQKGFIFNKNDYRTSSR